MVVLLQDEVVYLDGIICPFVQIDHLVVNSVPTCHQSGSIKTTGGSYKMNLWPL